MKKHLIPNTDLKVSRLAYGCMGIGGSWDNAPLTKEVTSKAIVSISTALEHGINFFDHADIYAHGKSELVFGKVLKEIKYIRDSMIIQTKCGIRFPGNPNPDSPGRYDFSYEHIINSVDGSLSRLGVEQLDILLLHRPDPLMEPEEVAKAFDELHKNGKVRFFGVSNFNPGQMTLLQNSMDQPIVVNQIEISLLHHHLFNDGILANQTTGKYAAATGIIDHCRLNNIQIQAWSPVALGKIFSPPSDADDNVKDLAKKIAVYAEEKGTSKEAIALAWLMKHPIGIQPVIGTTNPERIANSCKTDEITLSREEWYTLFTIARGNPVP
ncbi:MAG: aldo/keto reductase [Melioribacteraceae bacterium]|nr:aldo/keto reductase [Melioribacteraceae bacterium]